ncbi:hypothetical protein LARI1_G009060 [Lachnellula arida]|uniref:Uncharacterized protein n=1 Tax=Lachnellula arida TaxID=1316785 RepID=A0A8T9B421_9HELO|nr:hypothetical protein LARI1_G009060 [Lachnellula arida]
MPKYPGLGIPLRHFPQGDYNTYPMGAHGNCYGGDSALLPIREIAMMIIMDRLMDKPDWHKKVFDNEIIAKWRKEALDYPDDSLWKQATGGKVTNQMASRYPNHGDIHGASSNVKPLSGIMSTEAFDYCVQELQSKARYHEKTGLIPALDACASVVKSDKLVSSELQADLRNAFDKLQADQKASPDWHPNSNDMVQDLLHPSMYPLVSGRTKVFSKEVVGVNDAIDKWPGKGEVIKKDDEKPDPNSRYNCVIGGSMLPPSFWSDTYQWLPSNVAFQGDGSVKFTSYINNLHPNKYPDIYRTIEKLVERALPAWDQCLARAINYKEKTGAGRTTSRFSKPAEPDDETPENWNPSHPEPIKLVILQLTKRKDGLESLMSSVNREKKPDSSDSQGSVDLEEGSDESDESDDEYESKEEKIWHEIRRPVQLQPDPFENIADFYAPNEKARLSEKFKNKGLQIIVKMASIELTPEKSDFPVGGWHVEGQMNERICATALYYLDSENITPSKLSFRMQTSHYMNDEYEEGRILAFPNVFQHRVSPFRIADPTKPGHRRFIALWLVDPHVRIISTANVPPQQLDWWAESIFSKSNDGSSKLPVELAQLLQQKGVPIESSSNESGKLPPELDEMLREQFMGEGSLLMGEVEAREHREKLMQARSAFHCEADDRWHYTTYSFCEH